MLSFNFSLAKKSIIKEVFGNRDKTFFWEARFLPRWLPLLLGVVLGIITAILIVNEMWHIAVPIALLLPATMVFSHYPFVAVLLWLLLTPFFVETASPAARSIYWITHRAMIPAGLIIVILSDWLKIRKKKNLQLGRVEIVTLLILLLGIANIFVLSSGPRRELIRFYDRVFIPICMYWLIRFSAPEDDDLKQFLWVAWFFVIVQSAVGLLSWFAPQALPPQWIHRHQGARTSGTFVSVAVYSSTLIFCSIFLFQYAMITKSRWLRAALLTSVGLAFFMVFFTFSRGSWLGGLLVWAGLMVLYPKPVLRLTFIVLLITVVLSSSLLASQISWAWERLNTEDTAESRLVSNNASIQMIKAKPWFGWGFNNWNNSSRPFKTRVADIAVKAHSTSHNTYLTILAEMGVIFFFLYIIFPVAWWLWLTLKVRRRMPRDGLWSWQLLVMLWLLLLDHFTVSNFMDMFRFNEFGTTVWWMALALIANMVSAHLKSGDVGAPEWAYQHPPKFDMLRQGRSYTLSEK